MARARVQPATSLTTLISDPTDDTMSDEILGEAPDSNQENFIPGRSTAQKNKPFMANARARSAVTKKGIASKSRLATTRKATKREVIEQENAEDGEEDVDELDDMDIAPAPEVQRPRERQMHKGKVSGSNHNVPSRTIEESTEYKQPTRQSPRKAAQKVNGSHIVPQPFYEIQSDEADADGISEADFIVEELAQQAVYPNVQQTRARSTSQQPVSTILNRQRRAGSTSSNEGKNPDPALRRKLGEITKKFDALEIKYRKLHDIGVTEAKANFDKLKAASDEKARISTELIQSLKKELAAQKEMSQQAQTRINEADSHKTILADTRAQLLATKKEMAEIKAERTEVKAELVDAKAQIKAHSSIATQLNESKAQTATLTKQLSEAQREHTNLQAKLATARAASSDRQTPGSAMKGAKVPVMKVMTTTAEAAAAVQEAHSKIDLYSDLTGLLIRSVERRPEEHLDIFDCIQTGRNGTLHFKLSVSNDAAESYDEAEFSYLPQLNAARDKPLMDLLPYYLREDIQFSRQEAAKFYSRVFEILTRRYEDAAGDEGEDEE